MQSMLVEFSVENFLSFKEKVVFSMLASSDNEHEDYNVVTLPDGTRVLKSAVIYGANASGKSNLLKAIDFVSTFVNESHIRQIGDPTGSIPFLLNKEFQGMESKFQVIFYTSGVKYIYGFSCTELDVIEEYLYYYPKGAKATIFEREDVSEYSFTVDKNEQDKISKRNACNKLYISTAANWSYEKATKPFGFLRRLFLLTDSFSKEMLNKINKSSSEDGEIRALEILNKWVNTIDVGISEIEILDNPDLNKTQDLFERIKTVHSLTDEDGGLRQHNFSYVNESDGTKKFILYSAYIIGALYLSYKNVIVDELENKFHSLLSRFIIEQFHSEETNPMNAQLIFTTHDTNLLDLTLFRRDQVYFTEKSIETGATDLYSLDDFGVRKDAKIEKGYLMGKYGAIPFIGGVN